VLVELPMPDREARLAIFRVHTRGKPLASDPSAALRHGSGQGSGQAVDLAELAERTEGLVGADIEGLCRQAAMLAIREFLEGQRVPAPDAPLDQLCIGRRHFEKALTDRTTDRRI
jgi:transitional endoplasmic reticulum ATPase